MSVSPEKYVLYRRGSRVSNGTCATADEEIWQNSGAGTSLGAMALKHLAREKQRRTRYVRHLKSCAVENAVDVLDANKAHRELCIHHGIDQQWATVAAASRRFTDHSAQSRSFVATSRSTFVSTSVITPRRESEP